MTRTQNSAHQRGHAVPTGITREFLTYEESVDRLGTSETVRQAILTEILRAYVELNRVATIPLSIYQDAIDSGRTKFCAWTRKAQLHRAEDVQRGDYATVVAPDEAREGVFAEAPYYTLSGWYLLSQSDACLIARDIEKASRTVLHLARATDNGRENEETPEWFHVDIPVELTALWFRIGDIDRVAARTSSKVSNDTVSTRERNSMLRLISALATMAKLPEIAPAKAVEKQLDLLGLDGPKEATINRLLAEAHAVTPMQNGSSRASTKP